MTYVKGIVKLAFKSWRKTIIKTDDGLSVEAIFPEIISASRATDIPSFYSEWFFNRLNAGYMKWINPFNTKNVQYVAFGDTRVFVFWSKNPKPMLSRLTELDSRGVHYYFHFTLNDYEKEGFEPRVPPLKNRLETFHRLSDRIGPERIIWRFDPVFLGSGIAMNEIIDRIYFIGKALKGYTNKLVFSFADISMYRSVRLNLKRDGLSYTEFTNELAREFSSKLLDAVGSLGFLVATCSEHLTPEQFNISRNRCIDDNLLIELWPDDAKLMRFLGHNPGLFGDEPHIYMKDKGQRSECGCIVSKDIGRYSTCPHLCAYCYANTNKNEVIRNFDRHMSIGESIC